jgi:hypothetical protein
MTKRVRRVIAVVLVIIVVSVAAWALWPKGYETGIASLEDILASSSTRRRESMPVIVTSEKPYLALIATPITMYYDNELNSAPLLVVDPEEPSRAVIRFLELYGNPPVVALGDVPSILASHEREWEGPSIINLDISWIATGSVKDISLRAAKYFWSRSDGVIIVEPNQASYNLAVVVLPLASYLNIPVIVIDKMDNRVAGVLRDLGVKYSIVCSGSYNVEGYGETKRFASLTEVHQWTIRAIRERLGSEVNYITLTNPLDIYQPKVRDSVLAVNSTGTIAHSSVVVYPGRPEIGEGPYFEFEIPYKYANIKLDLRLDLSEEQLGDDSGARIYALFGKDLDGDQQLSEEEITFFIGSPASEYTGYDGDPNTGPPGIATIDGQPSKEFAVVKTSIPVFNDLTTYGVQLLAKLPTDEDRLLPGEEWAADYTLQIVIEELESYIYPRVRQISALAGYLTAYRKGVVLAKPQYMLYNSEYVELENSASPASNSALRGPTNERVGEIKKELNSLLGLIANMPVESENDIIALANYYYPLAEGGETLRRNITYLAILADPTMIPHYYYVSQRLGDNALEGFYVPSDNIYSDIDADLEMPPYGLQEGYPRLELADGRITGFDFQDVSVVLARTLFYSRIISEFQGPRQGQPVYDPTDQYWKNSGITWLGTEPPVETAKTNLQKVSLMWDDAGFSTYDAPWDPATGEWSARQEAAPYYESTNYNLGCAHGFWYWYVPTGIRSHAPYFEIGAGGAFDVPHVKLMNFGPSVMFALSCVTGRIDGLDPKSCLALAFLHAGFGVYIGGTRSMWGSLVPTPDLHQGEKLGSLVALYMYSYMCGKRYNKTLDDGTVIIDDMPIADLPVGAALMLAKNEFILTQGTDSGSHNDDTYEAILLHGDPAFNTYEPNHEGTAS